MALPASKLNKELYADVTKLKLLTPTSTPTKFKLLKSPFDDDDEDDAGAAATPKEIIVTGQIFPNSEIFKQGSYEIQMKLTPAYPFEPPEVRFRTLIYHPNVDKDGTFCHEVLKKTAKWTNKTSLVDVVKAVTDRVDNPDIDYSFSLELGREYLENRPEFNRKALEFVKKNALPRS